MPRRALDLLLVPPLLLLALPVMLLLAVLIRLDSPGPALFRQQRVGRGGVPFEMLKFRTMVHAPQPEAMPLTVGDDPRITRLGRWLRRTRLDELPQLVNVLRGEMALVGPRPEVPRYVERYPAALRERVLSVRPGITDPSSLEHLDEAAELAAAADPEQHYIAVVLPRKLATAAAYAERATPWTDLAVLARTAARLLGWSGHG